MPHQSTPNERVRQSNEENLDMIGDLLIERIQSSKRLNASLQTQLYVPLQLSNEVNTSITHFY